MGESLKQKKRLLTGTGVILLIVGNLKATAVPSPTPVLEAFEQNGKFSTLPLTEKKGFQSGSFKGNYLREPIQYAKSHIQNRIHELIQNPKSHIQNRTVLTPSNVSQNAIPNPIFPPEPELPPPTLPQPEPIPLEPPPSSPTPEQMPIQIPGTIRVERFEFEGNTAFKDVELAEVTQRFTGREITFAELLEAEAVVTQKYVDAGYINSGAVIPAEQTFQRQDAVVKIQIIEGGLEGIEVIGTRRLNPNYVRSRLALATRSPLNRNRLLEALQLLQLNPLIQTISAELQAGSRPEESRLIVQVTESSALVIEPFIDNNRSPSIGSFRRGMILGHNNVLGWGDGLEIFYANTDGSNELDLSYTLPINSRNGTIRFSSGFTRTWVIEEPFEELDISGKSRTYEVTYRQPILQKPTEALGLGLTFSREETQTFLLGEPFPLSPGANDDGETKVSVFRFFQDYVKRNSNQVFATRSQFSLGVNLLDSTINEEGADSQFFAWRGQAQYVRQLAPETLFILRSDLQLSTAPLLSLEQIGLGGLDSVRGYRQDLLITDNGILASAEVRVPILRISKINSLLQVAPFIDFGMGWNDNGEEVNPDSNKLLGVGFGLIWQMDDYLSARIDYGIPLIDVNFGDQTWQEQGIYFRINVSPF